MDSSFIKEKFTGSLSFIFTAEWDCVSKNKRVDYLRNRYDVSISQRLNMGKALDVLLSTDWWTPYPPVQDITTVKDIANGKNQWDDQNGFKADGGDAWLYREFMYFTGRVRPLIYNTCGYSKDKNEFLKEVRRRKPACVILKRKLSCEKEKNRYLLLRKKGAAFVLYSLPLTSVQLRLYASGVLNFSICCNDELDASKNPIRKKNVSAADPLCWQGGAGWGETTAEDIAWIRDAGRRLIWPYMDMIPNNAPVYSALQMGETHVVLCDYRSLCGRGTGAVTKPEYFEWTQDLINEDCVTFMKLRKDPSIAPRKDMLVIQYFDDDRTYLHNTLVASEDFYGLVKEGWIRRKEITNLNKEQVGCPARGLQAWYAILASDPDWLDPCCQDADMLVQKCEEATYARWLDAGTIYGLYYDVMTQFVREDSPEFLYRNMDWMYYQLFLLAIMQRSSIQRFYREASGTVLAGGFRSGKIGALKEKYAFFMSSMWFTEVTEQDQGCDIFDRIRKNMNLQEGVDLLRDAIGELNAVSEKNLEKAVNDAVVPATLFGLFLSFLNGLWQWSDADCLVNFYSHSFWQLIGVCLGLIVVSLVFTFWGWKAAKFLWSLSRGK